MKKRISEEEYKKLSKKDKSKFKEMWFDEQFSGMDDIDFTIRCELAGFKKVVVDYWVHHHQLTERNITHNSKHLQEMGKLFRKKWKLGEFKNA